MTLTKGINSVIPHNREGLTKEIDFVLLTLKTRKGCVILTLTSAINFEILTLSKRPNCLILTLTGYIILTLKN